MSERFWKSVSELAAMREHIPPERRAGSLVREWFNEQGSGTMGKLADRARDQARAIVNRIVPTGTRPHDYIELSRQTLENEIARAIVLGAENASALTMGEGSGE